MSISWEHAYRIESIVTKYLCCNRGGFGGLVDAKNYEDNPLEAAIELSMRFYQLKYKDDIDTFFAKWRTIFRDNSDNYGTIISDYILDLDKIGEKLSN